MISEEGREKNIVCTKKTNIFLYKIFNTRIFKNYVLSYEYGLNFYAHTHTTFLITSYEAYLSSPPL